MTVQTSKITKKQREWLNHLVRLNSSITFRFNNRPSTVSFETDEINIILSEIESIKALPTPSQYAKLRMIFDESFVYTPRTRRTAAATQAAQVVVEPILEAPVPIQVMEPVIESPVQIDEIISLPAIESLVESIPEAITEEPEVVPAPQAEQPNITEVRMTNKTIDDLDFTKVDPNDLEEANLVVEYFETCAEAWSERTGLPPHKYPACEEEKELYRKCRASVDRHYTTPAPISEVRGNKHRDTINNLTKEEHDSLVTTQIYNYVKQEPPFDPNYRIIEKPVEVIKVEPIKQAVKKEEPFKLQYRSASQIEEDEMRKKLEEIRAAEKEEQLRQFMEEMQTPKQVVEVKASIPEPDYDSHSYSDEEINSARAYVRNMTKFLESDTGRNSYTMPAHTKELFENKKIIAKCKLTSERG